MPKYTWIELKIKDKSTVYVKMTYEGYKILPDGSVSNWLETEFSMKGWKITGVGIMNDCICVEVE